MQQYRHFKGNLYTLFSVGTCAEEGEFYAVYSRSDNLPDGHRYTWGYARHSETEEIYAVEHDGTISKALTWVGR